MKKTYIKRDCCSLHIILRFMTTVICDHYAKHESKVKKTYCCSKNINLENN